MDPLSVEQLSIRWSASKAKAKYAGLRAAQMDSVGRDCPAWTAKADITTGPRGICKSQFLGANGLFENPAQTRRIALPTFTLRRHFCPYDRKLYVRQHDGTHARRIRPLHPDFPTAWATGKIEKDENAAPSFAVLALTTSPSLQRQAAKIFSNDKCPADSSLGRIMKRPRSDKIRIGYFSADFYNHPTSYLIAELFEQHDKDRFEWTAFSFGPERNDEMRRRISAAICRFIDVGNQSDREIAALARKWEIDIAVDLKGFTQDQRVGIFSFRAAPIQVNYLGYPGTMASECIDYLIADKTLIPAHAQAHYSEKIIYLPNSYQVNDTKRRIADRTFTRQELGLPEVGFVFCCFNSNYKIIPATFDGWMRILHRVPGSVLWLFGGAPTATINLRKEARARGIGDDRLIFAERLPLPEHLARHSAADLFLDTLPCNAHTTASDALWAGLPVLTGMGESFASRVAASLLNAIHLPELITQTQADYEALAIELATNPEKLSVVKEKLAANRLTAPLFDTPLFTKHIEAGYRQMYERYQADLPPDHVYIEP
jgi:predicted O-linked N-acetylglucosamine transferase (SPINDLY family)